MLYEDMRAGMLGKRIIDTLFPSDAPDGASQQRLHVYSFGFLSSFAEARREALRRCRNCDLLLVVAGRSGRIPANTYRWLDELLRVRRTPPRVALHPLETWIDNDREAQRIATQWWNFVGHIRALQAESKVRFICPDGADARFEDSINRHRPTKPPGIQTAEEPGV